MLFVITLQFKGLVHPKMKIMSLIVTLSVKS